MGLEKLAKYVVRFKIIFLFIAFAQLTACSNPGNKTTSAPESTCAVSEQEDKIYDPDFVRCSLQDAYYLPLNDKIITKTLGGSVFEEKDKDGKKQFYQTVSQYLKFDLKFRVDKIFSYKDKTIYMGCPYEYGKDIRMVVIQDNVTSKVDTFYIDGDGSSNYYKLGNRIYFDVCDDPKGYIIKFLNLDTLSQEVAYMTSSGEFVDASFVVRKDGAIAFSILYKNGVTIISKFSDSKCIDVIKKKWLNIVDFDERGIFYTEYKGIGAARNIKSLLKEGSFSQHDLVLSKEDGSESILFSGGEGFYHSNEFKIFNNFFLRLDKVDANHIEKYNYDGKLVEDIKLKQWPNLGKNILTDERVIYYNGIIKNVFYREDIKSLETQDIKIE